MALEWPQHFFTYKSMGIFPDAQGQLTPQSEVEPSRNSNSSEMLWLSLLFLLTYNSHILDTNIRLDSLCRCILVVVSWYQQTENLHTVCVQTAERRRRLQRPIRLARFMILTLSLDYVTSRDTMLFMEV